MSSPTVEMARKTNVDLLILSFLILTISCDAFMTLGNGGKGNIYSLLALLSPKFLTALLTPQDSRNSTNACKNLLGGQVLAKSIPIT